MLGLIPFQPELIVSGINHGSNLGDDITYSGTVAAALEGVVLGIPAVAVSQQAERGRLDAWTGPASWSGGDFAQSAAFTAAVVDRLDEVPMPEGTLLNINAPAGDAAGAEACRLGKRIYRDELHEAGQSDGRKRYRIYGAEPGYHEEEGTDFAALAAGRVAVTPLHFDLTDQAGIEALGGFDLEALLKPAAEEV